MNKSLAMAILAAGILKTTHDDYKNLRQRQKDMKEANTIGGDNYYHRLGMCENAQKGWADALISLGGGIVKEADDLHNKVPRDGWESALKDSAKDMKNNLEGLYWGLTHQNGDCKIWLENLDKATNTWKNKK